MHGEKALIVRVLSSSAPLVSALETSFEQIQASAVSVRIVSMGLGTNTR